MSRAAFPTASIHPISLSGFSPSHNEYFSRETLDFRSLVWQTTGFRKTALSAGIVIPVKNHRNTMLTATYGLLGIRI
jgi:hypothetical protein